jgi:hypothetical protein
MGIKLITARFGVSETTVRIIVQAYNEKIDNHERYPDLSPIMSGRVGPDSQLTPELADCIVEFNSMEGYKMTVNDPSIQWNLRNNHPKYNHA